MQLTSLNKKNITCSSKKWLKRQLKDPYVIKSKQDGYRSRSAYKLLEIHSKFELFKIGMNIIDLGAAPGGWSQVASKITNINKSQQNIIAVDYLDIKPIIGVEHLKSNFNDQNIKHNIINILNTKIFNKNKYLNIIMSDMSNNKTGNNSIDHIQTLDLCNSAIELALDILMPNGHFITKIFFCGLEQLLFKKAKKNFCTVKYFKPKSSHKNSSEIYLIALNKK